MSPRFAPLLALASLVAFGPSAVAGAPSPAGKHETVSYADLNVRSQEGAGLLMGRLRVAARDVCGVAPAFEEMKESRLYEGCIETALNKAVADVGSPEVASLYDPRTIPATIAIL